MEEMLDSLEQIMVDIVADLRIFRKECEFQAV